MFNPLNLISKFVKSANQKELDRIKKIVEKINLLEEKFITLNDEEFPKKTNEFKNQLKNGVSLDQLLPEAFALVREAAKRTRKERHFDVQLIGGVALHEGKIAEMRTGEGKTLTITLAAYLNALSEKGVHIVTVNDYLAKRDSIEMGEIYNFLGLKSGFINNDQNDLERNKNYNCDITYATNSELGFDYLRDNMKFSEKEMVQRDHYFSIVDEIDSCLIDEARTPLVISGAAEDKTAQYLAIDKLIKLLNDKDFDIDEKERSILLTNDGINNVEKLFSDAGILKNNNFYDPENLHLVHHVNQALRANHLFVEGKDYVVKDGNLKIIDELTGRILEGRRFGDGLHQALEAKEKIQVQAENQTLASITYQNYFKLYKKLSGCTGTAATESEEFFEIYSLPVLVIPTNNEMIRKDFNDLIFRTEKEKYDAITKKIVDCNKTGQPILVGTTSIEKSEKISQFLKEKNLKHNILNAKFHEEEAKIIAEAGKVNAITIATNMAGRGTDIKLGGKSESNESKVKSIGGLCVIGTERHESRRIDNQLRGRSGRQGDPGTSIFFISLQDELMRLFGGNQIDGVLEKLGLKENESIDHPWINKAMERAQKKVEARNFDIRKTLIKFDDVMNDQRQVIFSQRLNILKQSNIYEMLKDFLDELSKKILKIKINYKNSSDEKEFLAGVKNVTGNAISDEHLLKYGNLEDKEFSKKIDEIFNKKRDEKVKLIGNEQYHDLEKKIFLQILDFSWRTHLQYLEQLRQVIGLRSYGQKDPLSEFKKEAFTLFEALLEKVKTDVVKFLLNMNLVLTDETKEKKQPLETNQKTGRNDKCPCGSGKKYKHCCGSV